MLVLVVTVSPAIAVEVVYVQERVSLRWEKAVRVAISKVDRYTGSDMRLVSSCPVTADRCIQFRTANLTGVHGTTEFYQSDLDSAVITLDTQYSTTYPWKAKITLGMHELGHAH